MTVEKIRIPYRPRPLQLEYHENRTRFSVKVCHRRFGKTIMVVNGLQRSALTIQRPSVRVGYIAPTYTQAKRVAWDYAKHFASPIPGVQFNESELRIDYPNGARFNLYGADNADSLRGIYLDDAALDEYQLFDPRVFPEVVRPALADRGGGALFTGTPQGRQNPLYQIWSTAEREGWYCRIHKASETGYVPQAELDEARKIMSEDQYLQEFECSWDASVLGAVYGKELREADAGRRIGNVPYDPTQVVHTAWDLGISDATAIWFYQVAGQELHLIDYYENSGQALAHYVHVIDDKRIKGKWKLGNNWLPHDVEARELGTGKSRKEVLEGLGLAVSLTPRLSVEDGIEAARVLLRRAWFDRTNCERGLTALHAYRREFDPKRNDLKPQPLHDWSSHAADALRTLAVGYDKNNPTRVSVEKLMNYSTAFG